jgi:hypothetical protein
MQFLFSVIDATDGSSTSSEMADIDAFNDRLEANGHWVFAGGLGTNANATTVDNRDGAQLVTEGPFVESKEYLGGIWIIEATDLDAALKLAAEGSMACGRKVEVRPFF